MTSEQKRNDLVDGGDKYPSDDSSSETDLDLEGQKELPKTPFPNINQRDNPLSMTETGILSNATSDGGQDCILDESGASQPARNRSAVSTTTTIQQPNHPITVTHPDASSFTAIPHRENDETLHEILHFPTHPTTSSFTTIPSRENDEILHFPTEHNKSSSTAIPPRRNDEVLHFPKDSYSFIALHGPFEIPAFFWFGFLVFLLQVGFYAVIIASVFHPVWSTNGQDENPVSSAIGSMVPANATPIVRATQVLASLSYIFITDLSMDEFATAFDIFPHVDDANKDGTRRLRLSCGLRLIQGLFALCTAIILILSSNDAIETVLNFTALNFVSNFDNVVFRLALSGKYGEDFQEEARNIHDGRKQLPESMRSRKINTRYLWSVALCATVLIPCVSGVIYAQNNDDIWVTKVMRVEFEGVDLQPFTGCYSVDNGSNYTTYRRKVYKKNGDDNGDDEKVLPSFAYCAERRRWLLLEPTDERNVCNVSENEVAYSSKTESFDVFTEFDEQWFSASGTPLTLNFIAFTEETDQDCSLLENGECNDSFNELKYRFDGGDCCATSCTNARCASFNNVTAFGMTGLRGIHFPKCINPKMLDVTIRLRNFTSSWEKSNLDALYKERDRDYDQLFELSESPVPSSLTLECDGRFVLVIDVDDRMSEQTITVKINDGAECTIKVETDVEDENCFRDCYRTEHQFWIFDYAVFEGSSVDNAKKMLEHNSASQDMSSFLRIPRCFSEKISMIFNDSNFYEDELVMKSVEWMAKDNSVYSDCRDDTFLQRFELLLTFFTLDPDNEHLATFVRSSSACLWESVECQDGDFNRLDLTALNLKHYIPSVLGLLTPLRVLELSHNLLSGMVPTEIGNLKELISLDLSWNQLSGVPTEIGNLNQLTSLGLWNNRMTLIPTEIGNLQRLSELYLQDNQISVIPTELGKLGRLTELNLQRNQIHSIPTEIGNLEQLTILYLLDNKISVIPTEIGNLKQMTRLYLGDNAVSAIPTEIGNLQQLTQLYLTKNRISVIPTEITNLEQLTSLYLWDNKLTLIPKEIGNLKRLTELYLEDNQISAIPKEIGNLERLTELSLEHNQISAIPTEIGNLDQLTYLNLWNNQISEIPTEIGKLTTLEYLDLQHNVLSGELPDEIGLLTSLTCLGVRGNSNLTISDALRDTILGFPNYFSASPTCFLEP